MVERRGFTLVELLVAITVTTLVMSAAYGLYGFFMKNVAESQRVSSRSRETYRSVSMIESQLRRSQALLSISSDSLEFANSDGDTARYLFREDTLFLKSGDTQRRYHIDSLQFELIDSAESWVPVRITGSYIGRDSVIHTVSRTVTCHFTPDTSSGGWGF